MTLRPVDRSRYSKSTASRLRRYYQADGPCRLLPQSSEPTKLSSRAALLDNFETNGPGTFPAERAAIGDPSHRFGVSELPQHCQQTRSNLAAGAISMHLRRASTTSYEDVPWRGTRDVVDVFQTRRLRCFQSEAAASDDFATSVSAGCSTGTNEVRSRRQSGNVSDG